MPHRQSGSRRIEHSLGSSRPGSHVSVEERPPIGCRTQGLVESDEHAIADLAKRTHQPLETVKRVYEEQLAILGADAKITHYIDVLAKRRTREILSRSAPGAGSASQGELRAVPRP